MKPQDAEEKLAQDLMDHFESIGDNCEFGYVQRHYHNATISLFRWAGISLAGMVKGLQSDFDNLFEFANLLPGWPPAVVKDSEYDIWFHTQLKVVLIERKAFFAADLEEQLAQHSAEAKRIAFLRRKFLEDLVTGHRIYIFKSSAALTSEEINSLHVALERRRQQRLLCVVPASPDLPAGSVIMDKPRVKIATLGRFAPVTKADDADFKGWLEICRQAACTPWE